MILKDIFFNAARNVNIRFKSADELVLSEDVMRKLGAYVPDIALRGNAPWKSDIDFLHVHAEPYLEQSNENGTQRIVLASPKGEGLPEDIYHLLYAALRKQLLEHENRPVMHAACVVKNGKARLITGASGSGKTTLAQKLIDEEGYKLVSGNKTVLDLAGREIYAVSGTKTMTALDQQFNRYAYGLPAYQEAPEGDYAVEEIDIIRLNDGVEECEILSPLSALHTLYPLVMDSANSDIIACGEYVFDGGVSPRAKRTVIKGLNRALQAIPVRKIAGNPSYIKQVING